jgi:flagellar basal body rod protein FlgB
LETEKVITDESLKQTGKRQEVKSRTTISDNLTEVLQRVLEFTHLRQKILVSNLRDFDKPGFVPTDLPCGEFSDLLNIALNEQEKNNRLLFIDTHNIKFFRGGCFEARTIADNYANYLLKISSERYRRYQVDKIIENALNQKFAAQLLRQKRQQNIT